MSSYLLKVLPYVAVGAVCTGLGWKVRDRDYQEHLKKDAQAQVTATQAARAVEHKAEDISQGVREEVAKEQARTQVIYKTITEKVPVYVTQTKIEKRVVASGGLPAGFVWTYNGAASNSEAPLPTGIDPDTPSGVDLSTVASVTAGNFALYHQCRADLRGWQTWYEKLKATWPDTASQGKE